MTVHNSNSPSGIWSLTQAMQTTPIQSCMDIWSAKSWHYVELHTHNTTTFSGSAIKVKGLKKQYSFTKNGLPKKCHL